MPPSTKLSPSAQAPGPQAPSPAEGTAHAPAARSRRGRFVPLLLSAPAVLILAFVFVTPVVLLVIVSFFPNDDLAGMHTGFRPSNYSYFWTQRYFFSALGRTFGLALMTTLLTAAISYPLALVLNRRGRRVRVAIAMIVVLPIFVSMVERTLGWLSIYSSGGLLDRFGALFGFHFPSLLYSERGLVIGLTNMLLPFMFLSVYASVRRIDPLVREAAATLGASPARVFWKVTLPLTYSGLSAGATLVFSLAASNVIVTMMLGGSGMTTLPTLLYEEATVSVNYPLSAVVGVSVSALILVAIWVIMRLGGKDNRHDTVVLP